VQESLHVILKGREIEQAIVREEPADFDLHELIRELERDMATAAANLEYERAALVRDQIAELKSGAGLSKIAPRPMKYPLGRRARRKTPIA
jgi:excinuclease ABC subunit B